MTKTIQFKESEYPEFQSVGFASKFAFPFALEVCKGVGLDIGCGKPEWCLPGAIPIDPAISGNQWHADMLPSQKEPLEEEKAIMGVLACTCDSPEYDYIFSSHCLEHLENWVQTLDYWTECLKSGGVLFLYLPDFSQKYWRPWNNRKHLHSFTPELLTAWFNENGYTKVFCSGVDLNNSFMIMGEKI